MPTNHGSGLHENQSASPAAPDAAERYPQEPIAEMQYRSRLLALEDGELLTESDGL